MTMDNDKIIEKLSILESQISDLRCAINEIKTMFENGYHPAAMKAEIDGIKSAVQDNTKTIKYILTSIFAVFLGLIASLFKK